MINGDLTLIEIALENTFFNFIEEAAYEYKIKKFSKYDKNWEKIIENELRIRCENSNGWHMYQMYILNGRYTTLSNFHHLCRGELFHKFSEEIDLNLKCIEHLGYHYNTTINGQNKIILSLLTSEPNFYIGGHKIENILINENGFKYMNKGIVVDKDIFHQYIAIMNDPTMIPKSLKENSINTNFDTLTRGFKKALENKFIDFNKLTYTEGISILDGVLYNISDNEREMIIKIYEENLTNPDSNYRKKAISDMFIKNFYKDIYKFDHLKIKKAMKMYI